MDPMSNSFQFIVHAWKAPLRTFIFHCEHRHQLVLREINNPPPSLEVVVNNFSLQQNPLESTASRWLCWWRLNRFYWRLLLLTSRLIGKKSATSDCYESFVQFRWLNLIFSATIATWTVFMTLNRFRAQQKQSEKSCVKHTALRRLIESSSSSLIAQTTTWLRFFH